MKNRKQKGSFIMEKKKKKKSRVNINPEKAKKFIKIMKAKK